MREIRDLALSTRDFGEYVEQHFRQSREAFEDRAKRWAGGEPKIRCIRTTAVPVDPDRIHFQAAKSTKQLGHLVSGTGTWVAENGQTGHLEALLPTQVLNWRPRMRGAVSPEQLTADWLLRLGVGDNGVVELEFGMVDDNQPELVYPDWLAGVVLNSLVMADRVRRIAVEVGMHYGIEVQLFVPSNQYTVLHGWGSRRPRGQGSCRFSSGDVLFPRYAFIDSFDDVMRPFVRDLENEVGRQALPDSQWEIDNH